MLLLAEELLLLALDDEKGSIRSSVSMPLKFGLTGALLMELVLLGKLCFNNEEILIKDDLPTGDALLDEVLTKISNSKKKTPNYLVRKISNGIKDIKERLINRLIEKNILRKEEQKVLWVFKANRYPANNSEFENEIKQRIYGVVMNEEALDTRFIVLLSLVHACNLVSDIFSSVEKKTAKNKIKELIKGELVGKAVSDIVNSVNAAVMASIIATTR